MGCYINPVDQSKEDWLKDNGVSIPGPVPITKTHLPVCLVDNVLFTAAGIGYCNAETDYFAKPDGRAKKWFQVPRVKLRLVSDLSKYEEQM